MEADGVDRKAAPGGTPAEGRVTNPQEDFDASVQVSGQLGGCQVVVSFDTKDSFLKDRLLSTIKKLQAIGLEEPVPADKHRREATDDAEESLESDPIGSLSTETDIPAQNLRKLLGIKGDSIQLYKASQYRMYDAIAILLFVNEKGLGKPYTRYEELAALLESNHVKTSTPLPTTCFNLIRDGNVDKKAYETSKQIILTPAGEKKAIKALQNPEESKAARPAVAKKPTKAANPKSRAKRGNA